MTFLTPFLDQIYNYRIFSIMKTMKVKIMVINFLKKKLKKYNRCHKIKKKIKKSLRDLKNARKIKKK